MQRVGDDACGVDDDTDALHSASDYGAARGGGFHEPCGAAR